MRWLHISDIHFNPGKDGRSTKQLRDKLPQYLIDNKIRVDEIFVTGDYRNAATQLDNEEMVAENATEYIRRIAESIGIHDSDHIHIVPGNHDLKRIVDTKELAVVRENYDFESGIFNDDDIKKLLEQFSFFKHLNATLYTGNSMWAENLLPLHAYRIYNDFSILYMNTCVTCGSNDERGKLVIGNYDLYMALDEIKRKKPTNPIIVLAHHGMEHFAIQEREVVETLFKDYPVRIYLCGDSHRIWYRQTNGVTEITMGCIKQAVGVDAVFSIGEIIDDSISLTAFKWDYKFCRWGTYVQFNEAILDQINKNKIRSDVLSSTDYKEIYNILNKSIDEGNISLVNGIVNEILIKIDNKENPYILCVQVKLNYFLNLAPNYCDALKRFIDCFPPNEIINDIALFFIQIQHKESLNDILKHIKDDTIKNVIQYLLSSQPVDMFCSYVNEGRIIEKYRNSLHVCWALANHTYEHGPLISSVTLFQHINNIQQNFIATFKGNIASLKNMITYSSDDLSKSKWEKYFNLIKDAKKGQHQYKDMHQQLYLKWWRLYLEVSSVIDCVAFEQIVSTIEDEIASLIDIEFYRYLNKINNKVVDDAIIDYCITHKQDLLLCSYLSNFEIGQSTVNIFEENRSILHSSLHCFSFYIQAVEITHSFDEAVKRLDDFQQYRDSFITELFMTRKILMGLAKDDNHIVKKLYEKFKAEQGVTIPNLCQMLQLLVNFRYFDESEELYNNFFAITPELTKAYISYLIKHNDKNERCVHLIDYLISNDYADEFDYYQKGLLIQKENVIGSLSSFEKSFEIRKTSRAAYSILAMRLNLSKVKDDEVLKYCSLVDNWECHLVAALTYQRLRNWHEQEYHILRGLMLCGEKYNADLYMYFIQKNLMSKQQEKEILDIQEDCIVVLNELITNEQIFICIHADERLLKGITSNFARCVHVTLNLPEIISMRFKSVDMLTEYSGKTYTIKSIIDRNTYFHQYCFSEIVHHNDMKTLSAENPEGLISKLIEVSAERKEIMSGHANTYNNEVGKFGFHLLAHAFGRTIFETITSMLLSPDYKFWSGLNIKQPLIKQKLLVTYSTLVVLLHLGIQVKDLRNIRDYLLVAPSTKMKFRSERDIILEQASISMGTMGISNDGRLEMYTYESSDRVAISSQLSVLSAIIEDMYEWALPADISIKELIHVIDGIGVADYDSISVAKQYDLRLITDDLIINRLAKHLGVECSNSLDIILLLNFGFEKTIELIRKLVGFNFCFPISVEILKYLSNKFDDCNDESELETRSLLAIDLFDSVCTKELYEFFRLEVSEFLQDKTIHINETLRFLLLGKLVNYYMANLLDVKTTDIQI